jgi:hypothetical protein
LNQTELPVSKAEHARLSSGPCPVQNFFHWTVVMVMVTVAGALSPVPLLTTKLKT